MRKNNMHNTCKYLFYNNARAAPLCHAPQFTAQSLRRYFLWENVERKMGNVKCEKETTTAKTQQNTAKLFIQRSSTSEKFSARKRNFCAFFLFFFHFFSLVPSQYFEIFAPFWLPARCDAVEFSMFILKSCKNSKIKLCKKCE